MRVWIHSLSGTHKITVDCNKYKEEKARRHAAVCLKVLAYAALSAISVTGVIGLWRSSTGAILVLFGILGIVDAVIPRLHLINRCIAVLANRRAASVRKKEYETVQRIFRKSA